MCIYMTIGLKFLLYLYGKNFDFKKALFRYYGFLAEVNAFL